MLANRWMFLSLKCDMVSTFLLIAIGWITLSCLIAGCFGASCTPEGFEICRTVLKFWEKPENEKSQKLAKRNKNFIIKH